MSISARIPVVKELELSTRSVASQMLWILAFAVATVAAARFEIPHQPVPYTLQTLVVLLAGAFLGARNGAISQLVYLASGALGAPVFAGGSFGFIVLAGPTGGYLLAFPLAAAVVGFVARPQSSLLRSFAAMTSGLLVIFLLGTAQLYAVYFKDVTGAIMSGFLIFSWWDVLKLSAAAMIYHEMAKKWPRLPRIE